MMHVHVPFEPIDTTVSPLLWHAACHVTSPICMGSRDAADAAVAALLSINPAPLRAKHSNEELNTHESNILPPLPYPDLQDNFDPDPPPSGEWM